MKCFLDKENNETLRRNKTEIGLHLLAVDDKLWRKILLLLLSTIIIVDF